jgi:NAD-reducing hydrogenase small subunit
MSKMRLATVWLDGCSGCHMSFLDMDERLIDLAQKADLVYSPFVDTKEMPAEIDVALVEGAVSSEADLEKVRHLRERTKVLVSLGDCAVTGNVPAMRNFFGVDAVMKRVFQEPTSLNPKIPSIGVPKLLDRVRPVHEVVKVDVFVPGCPPSADVILYTVSELLEGRLPNLSERSRFGK